MGSPRSSHAGPGSRLTAVKEGGPGSFSEAVEPHLGELYAHCYRMLGSAHDADDALQDSLLRAWKSLASFDQRRALRPWLYKIATNVCRTMLGHRSRRVVSLDTMLDAMEQDTPRPESPLSTPYPEESSGLPGGYAPPDSRYEQREAVELAFAAALAHLPARQRAVLVLRDVLGFSVEEIVENLATSTASVNSALQRARQTLGDLLPRDSHYATNLGLGDCRVRALARQFVDAFEAGDIEGILGLLDGDASFAMPSATVLRAHRPVGFDRLHGHGRLQGKMTRGQVVAAKSPQLGHHFGA